MIFGIKRWGLVLSFLFLWVVSGFSQSNTMVQRIGSIDLMNEIGRAHV